MKKMLVIILSISVLSLFSCNEVKDAKNVANEFYTFCQNKEFEKTLTLVSESTYEYATKEQIVSELQTVQDVMGALKSYKSTSFEIKTANGKTLTYLIYEVVYENGTTTENLQLVKEDDGYKVFFYKWEQN